MSSESAREAGSLARSENYHFSCFANDLKFKQSKHTHLPNASISLIVWVKIHTNSPSCWRQIGVSPKREREGLFNQHSWSESRALNINSCRALTRWARIDTETSWVKISGKLLTLHIEEISAYLGNRLIRVERLSVEMIAVAADKRCGYCTRWSH